MSLKEVVGRCLWRVANAWVLGARWVLCSTGNKNAGCFHDNGGGGFKAQAPLRSIRRKRRKNERATLAGRVSSLSTCWGLGGVSRKPAFNGVSTHLAGRPPLGSHVHPSASSQLRLWRPVGERAMVVARGRDQSFMERLITSSRHSH